MDQLLEIMTLWYRQGYEAVCDRYVLLWAKYERIKYELQELNTHHGRLHHAHDQLLAQYAGLEGYANEQEDRADMYSNIVDNMIDTQACRSVRRCLIDEFNAVAGNYGEHRDYDDSGSETE